MLVLSRKIGEKLVIDGNITVEVLRVHGNRVALGISAPANVRVLRGELKPHPAEAAIDYSEIEMLLDEQLAPAC